MAGQFLVDATDYIRGNNMSPDVSAWLLTHTTKVELYQQAYELPHPLAKRYCKPGLALTSVPMLHFATLLEALKFTSLFGGEIYSMTGQIIGVQQTGS